jgi:acyl dehydratase
VIDYERVMALPALETTQAYTFRDTILYALGVGVSLDGSADDRDLKFVYEDGLFALPTMALVTGYPGFWLKLPQYGVTWQKVLHAEQDLQLHAPMPAEGAVRSKLVVEDIFDRGAEKGAYLVARREVYDDATGLKLATLKQLSVLRGDGGFGGRPMKSPASAPPSTRPDCVVDLKTLHGQALLYRLSGDLNPLHADPALARTLGYEMPILHGMCTLGFVGRALLRSLCENEPARFQSMSVRFSSPVYPGETIRTEIWKTQPGRATLQARVVERDVVVVSNGRFEYEE